MTNWLSSKIEIINYIDNLINRIYQIINLDTCESKIRNRYKFYLHNNFHFLNKKNFNQCLTLTKI